LLFIFALGNAIRKFQGHQGGLELKGTHKLLVHADDDNILGDNETAIKRNKEAL
jgi:hypothetical protein